MGLLSFFLKKTCSHEFPLENIKKTNLMKPEKPKTDLYTDWAKYFRNYGSHQSVTHRVVCQCTKCHKVYYARCGLELNGRVV